MTDWQTIFQAFYKAVADCEAPEGTQVDDALAKYQALYDEARVDRLSTPGKDYDHDAAPDSLPGPGDTCKTCGEDITWIGPSQSDWLHVDDKENR